LTEKTRAREVTHSRRKKLLDQKADWGGRRKKPGTGGEGFARTRELRTTKVNRGNSIFIREKSGRGKRKKRERGQKSVRRTTPGKD